MEQRINPLNTSQGRQTSQRSGNAVSGQNAASHRSSSGQTPRSVGGSTGNYGVSRSPSAIHVGDVLRGEITDLTNNEISITLEDNTTVHAKIADSSSYSIGQTGAFRLTEIAGNTLYLENVSKGYTETELTLINKALSEAGLPSTSHNQEAVKALMDNLLPITKTSIQNLMQQSYDFQTEDMNTLAVMNRLMMKMDSDSVAQFSNYRNDNYQLLERLQSFSQDIPALLSALSENAPADAVAGFGKTLLSIGLSTDNMTAQNQTGSTIASLPAQVQNDIAQMLSNTALTEDTASQLDQKTLSLQDALTLLRDAALSGTLKQPQGMSSAELASYLNQINAALEPTDTVQSPITENYVKNIITLQENQTEAGAADTAGESQTNPQSAQPDILSEQEAAEQTGEKNSGRFAFAGKFLQSISENAKNTLSDTFNVLNDALKSNSASAQESSLKTPEGTLDTLLNAYTKCARNQDFVSSYLTEDERAQLVRHLQNMPVSNSLLQRIISGTAATKDILTVIQNTIPLTDSENIKNLFQSDVFQKLFSRMLQSSWTLTPEQLSDGKLSDFYTKMQNQLSQLRTLIQNTLSGADSEQLGHAAQDIENNLSFMKTLNETFSFFQMPLKLQSQDAHGDLYVYSQKEKLRQHPEKASVLLHLDMENLGKTDIRIEKNNNDLIADFSLNDNETVELFRINAAMLESALQEQGYSCRLQFKEREQPSPSVDDFINSKVNTHATTEMKRFSFDIRA